MTGLMIKDLLVLKNNLLTKKYFLTLGLGFLVAVLFLRQSLMLIAIFLLFILLNNVVKVFMEDHYSGWLHFIQVTTPLKAPTIVLARYLSAGIYALLSNLVFTFLIADTLVFTHSFSWQTLFTIVPVTFVISLLYLTVAIPFLYLFLENGLFIMIVTLLIIGTALTKLTNIASFASGHLLLLSAKALIAIILLALISYGTSLMIFRVKQTKEQ
ncbi:MAG: ABC-2 transporter permease [Aerococcus sp.]|nr:ABC-2 transporter permease [Aerococcus sp.]